MHLQVADDLLLRVQEADQRALLSAAEYYGGSARVDSSRFDKRGEDYGGGHDRLRHQGRGEPPEDPGFWKLRAGTASDLVRRGAVHNASALLDGFTDHILIVIDMADPTKPVECGRWWIPGQNAAAGETPTWEGRCTLHHAIVFDDFAYGSWRDGGLTILDLEKDKSAPKLVSHRVWCPPFRWRHAQCRPAARSRSGGGAR